MGKRKYPDKQHIIRLVDDLYQLGLRNVVVCPGSRSAPLTLAFARHGKYRICTVIDERSAAYVALGQSLSACGTTAVAVVCTSGTALLNMGPAVAEAYYLRLPLLILSADRPSISIDQLDGQTIRQGRVFEAHTVYSGTLPEHGQTSIDLGRSRKSMHEAWTNMMGQQGPAHLNVPLHEPLYILPPNPAGRLGEEGNSFGSAHQIGGMKPVELTLFGSEEAEHYASPAVTKTSEDASRIATIVTNEPQPESGSKDGPIRPEGDPTFHQPEPIEKEWRWTKDARETLRLARKILLVPGQSTPDSRLDAVVRQWLRDPRVVVLAEPVSNLLNGATTIDGDGRNTGKIPGIVFRHEDLLAQEFAPTRELRPDVLISWGLQIVGKRTRNWLRRQAEVDERNPIGTAPPRHFRLDPLGWAPDPYHNPPTLIKLHPYLALEEMCDALHRESTDRPQQENKPSASPITPSKQVAAHATNQTYQEQWAGKERKAEDALIPLLQYLPFGDLAAVQEVGRHIQEAHAVHLGNSMPIRYWQMMGGGNKIWWLHANRGTSGIDGVNSTALGFAIRNPERIVWLITGDLSFVYDLNAFTCNERPDNLRIVVINNQGGDIFRLIDGPSRQPECEPLFVTPRTVDLQALAGAWGNDTYRATTLHELRTHLQSLDARPAGRGPAVLEVMTEPKANRIVYQAYQKAINTPL